MKFNPSLTKTLPVWPAEPGLATGTQQGMNGTSFQEVLEEKVAARGLRISNHARERIVRREVSLGEQEMAGLQRAIDLAAGKGARESLVLLDGLAAIVSVPNRTVITAFNREYLQESVITNIDSAVILKG